MTTTILIILAIITISNVLTFYRLIEIEKTIKTFWDSSANYITTLQNEIEKLCSQLDTHTLNDYAQLCHEEASRWWIDPHTNEPIERNFGEMLMLIVSELAEAMEGDRKSLMDDHLPSRPMVEVEIADTLIRLFDLAGARGYDLEGAFREKLAYNRERADHSLEARRHGGKRY